jgi:hypothetical protein
VRRSERSQQLFKLDFAEWVVLNRLQVSFIFVVGGSGRDWLAVGVEERRVRVDCCSYVAGVIDLSAIGGATRSVEAAFSGELRAAFEFVAAICVGRSGVVVFEVWKYFP